MRYIRFLKTPRIIDGKNPSKAHIYCLITITSDLGDSFLPFDLQLHAVVYPEEDGEEVTIRTTIEWTAGMRSLPIRLPLGRCRIVWPARIRIGVHPEPTADNFMDLLSAPESRGVISAWSAPLDPSNLVVEAAKLVERRFDLQFSNTLRILEETGDSIARHLWDAGVALSCHLGALIPNQKLSTPLKTAFQSPESKKRLQVLELGTGCGVVGLCLAQTIGSADVIASDLPEAKEIFSLNSRQTIVAANLPRSGSPAADMTDGSFYPNRRETITKDSTIMFQAIGWDKELPDLLNDWSGCRHCTQLDVIVAADCTYNPDSSPALVRTISQLVRNSPEAAVVIAMKVRHSSESVFFDLMYEAAFSKVHTESLQLPGDEAVGEETAEVFVFRYDNLDKIPRVVPNEYCKNQ
ncbi:putative methyltransferase-domain-containing protein [Clohesyomyces aquaticus]|uniref:Putative methyltransferase-domain-containing protein n=1 Tax=Clohesyomyces aquaticus TaxID=1231657 RepID=A0A1Y1ZPE6_9PLEO|nr:putative methyltransferase-domain-containing protein [Clohesyomyces aquaticus]